MEAFMDAYTDFLPRLSAFSLCKQIDVGYTLFKVYRAKCTHLGALLEGARQEYALAIVQQPSSSNAASVAKISSLEDDLRKTQRSLEACLLALERANIVAKLAEDGSKAADSALAAESSKDIGLQEQLVGANAKITRLEGQISSLEISR
ncbi:uncharacterized protein LOC113299744 [Papaver somniferum]|uniref:uncharacterized protein LOC113299744 n=1 Tax=Papaver somniferum TaxID=3469 RepID=UPI000E6FC3AC|nr:uncharacterized protein LOC113299744 [Papaver somniferum]